MPNSGIVSVSYTHLDVYKRQLYGRMVPDLLLRGRQLGQRTVRSRPLFRLGDTRIPVSYTHLDVYKRQDLLCR